MFWIPVAVHISCKCKIVTIIYYACIKKMNTISFFTLTLNYPFLNNGPILNFLLHFITIIADNNYYTIKDGRRIQSMKMFLWTFYIVTIHTYINIHVKFNVLNE